MTHHFFPLRALGSMLLVGVLLTGTARAQNGGAAVGIGFGSPFYGPGWGYPGLYGGPYIGFPYYPSKYHNFWTNGLSLYGPPIPVYGPIPGTFGNSDLVKNWQSHPGIFPGFGYFGIYSPSPRPKPATVNVWPQPVLEGVPTAPAPVGGPVQVGAAPPAAAPGRFPDPAACITLSVKVPQPAAEVFVDGTKTNMTGTDRVFQSPPLKDGGDYRYEVTARWVSGGATVEEKRTVAGKPGEVVRVDFTKSLAAGERR